MSRCEITHDHFDGVLPVDGCFDVEVAVDGPQDFLHYKEVIG